MTMAYRKFLFVVWYGIHSASPGALVIPLCLSVSVIRFGNLALFDIATLSRVSISSSQVSMVLRLLLLVDSSSPTLKCGGRARSYLNTALRDIGDCHRAACIKYTYITDLFTERQLVLV